MRTALAALTLAAALGAGSAAFAQAPASSPATDAVFAATTVNLAAYGETRIAPDQATINLGVSSRATTAQEAMRLNNVAMNAVVAALRRQGIAERDIQTSGLNLSPQQE